MFMLRFFSSAFLFVSLLGILQAQGPSRSGFPADAEDKRFLRRFPCGGTTILDETFQTDTLPDGWLALDEDGFTPREEIQFLTPLGGWQLVTDFKDDDSVNHVFASPSWYESDDGPSDDYLILPQTTLPANPCLSWYAYSQDKLFPESYEIRVSTTTPDAQGFLAHPPVVSIDAEGDDYTYRSTSLATYAGEIVYVAFRQTTDNGFILAIDDIRIANVKGRDLAMFNLNPVSGDPLDTLTFSGSVINLGLDTLAFDSAQMKISWQINNDPVLTSSIPNAFTLLPNDTIRFVHDSAWVPQTSASYRLRFWVSGIGMDDNIENDTLSRFQPIGTATNLQGEFQKAVTIYPTRNSGQFRIDLGETADTGSKFRIMTLTGQILYEAPIRTSPQLVTLSNLPAGMYWVIVEDIKLNRAIRRMIIE